MLEIDSGSVTPKEKFETYFIDIDPDQGNKATQIKICSFARPHMRAFHCAWFSFFIAVSIWFAIAPLLSEIQKSLGLTKQDIWTSNIIAVGGTMFMRILLGPACDKFGARVLCLGILCLGAIPTACVGLIHDATSLYIVRLFIGIAGGAFVTTQYWTSVMFTKEAVGTANGFAAGWGNLGGGVIQLIVGSGLFPLFKSLNGGNAEKAWRVSTIPPAIVAILSGITIFFISDDCPRGNYAEMKKNGTMPEVSAAASFRSGAINLNTWILFLQYAACFGVELTMNNASALYFKEEFKQTTENAAAIASIFGWMNLVCRGLGGWTSDKLSVKYGMKGRIWAQTVMLLGAGIFMILFANTKTLGGAIVLIVFLSIFVQGAEGATFAIVPYIDPPATGSIAGIVGSGGNVGAVIFGVCFRQLSYQTSFLIVGSTVLFASVARIFIEGSCSAICGKADNTLVTKKLNVLNVEQPCSDEIQAP